MTPRALIPMTALALGCPAPDDTGAGWTELDLEDVRAAVEAGCDAQSLAALEAYCRSGDLQRAWAGRISLTLD
jgi:hypothetical protein